jgi:hypothetical protein
MILRMLEGEERHILSSTWILENGQKHTYRLPTTILEISRRMMWIQERRQRKTRITFIPFFILPIDTDIDTKWTPIPLYLPIRLRPLSASHRSPSQTSAAASARKAFITPASAHYRHAHTSKQSKKGGPNIGKVMTSCDNIARHYRGTSHNLTPHPSPSQTPVPSHRGTTKNLRPAQPNPSQK